MRRQTLIVFSLLLVSFLIIPSFNARSTEAKTVDRHGKRVPSIFSGISPNPRIALEVSRIIITKDDRKNPGPCVVRDAIYRRADRPRFKKVGQLTCRSHYQVQYTYPAGCDNCGGGTENWTYSDPPNSTYCYGYEIDLTGCNSSCREDNECALPPIDCQGP
jgi:hypothetical protein